MIDRAEIEALIPHKHAMCLWDEVSSWDAQRIHLRASNHRDLPGAIECVAEQLAASEASQQYAFRITHAGMLLAEGRATVMLGV